MRAAQRRGEIRNPPFHFQSFLRWVLRQELIRQAAWVLRPAACLIPRTAQYPGGVLRRRRKRRSGQQMTEFVVLIGTVTLAVVAMTQSIGRRAIQTGIYHATNEILGVPEPDPPDTRLDATFTNTTTERGSASFRRTTDIDESSVGNSTNTDSSEGGVILPPLPE